MSKVLDFVKKLVPVHFVSDAEKVPPAVQAEIDKLSKDASDAVAALRANHSVKSINDKLDADLVAFEDFYKSHRQLLKADANARVAATAASLPPALWAQPK